MGGELQIGVTRLLAHHIPLLSNVNLKMKQHIGEGMQNQLDRIEWKLDQILASLAQKTSDASSRDEVSQTGTTNPQRRILDLVDMPQLTTKQHAALQMLLRGADNNEIAMRFDVSPNTSKVYVRGVAKKLGVQTRAQIVVKLLDTFNELDDNSYRMLTGGLPKDWDRNFEEPDPFAPLYKIKRGSNDT